MTLRVGSIVVMVLVWWLLTWFFPPSLIPLPSATFSEVISIVSTGQFFSEMGATLRRVGVGFGIAMSRRIREFRKMKEKGLE